MAKMTLLEIVNDIANDLDTESVTYITSTIESEQIAQIVKTCYFEIIANRNWPHLRRTVQLNSVLSLSRPTHLKLPDEAKELISFSYNKLTATEPGRDKFSELDYLEPEEFLRRTNARNLTQDNVIKITDFGGAYIYIKDDKQPEYYTSFDDSYIVLDSYDSDIESTVQNSNTQAIVYFDPVWSHTESAIPNLPSEAFPLLLEEAKSTAFLVLKQQANAKAEQKARRQNAWLSRKSWRVDGGVRYPDYGRKPVR